MPELELFDTHCHTHEMVTRTTSVYDKWHSENPDKTPESVIDAARAAGVMNMLNIGTTLADSEQAVQFAADRPGQWVSVGIHPHEAARHTDVDTKKQFANLLDTAAKSKIIAIGECGLDYFYGYSPREDQIDLLRFQIEVALEHNLPISFHVRDAFDDFWPVFESYSGIRGVLHSFTDSQANMERAAGHGLHFGVNGIATFAKSEAQHVIYRTIPQRLLLLETDAPFLTPAPFRGKVCESKHVRVTAEFLAHLRGEALEDLAAYTTANSHALFKV